MVATDANSQHLAIYFDTDVRNLAQRQSLTGIVAELNPRELPGATVTWYTTSASQPLLISMLVLVGALRVAFIHRAIISDEK